MTRGRGRGRGRGRATRNAGRVLVDEPAAEETRNAEETMADETMAEETMAEETLITPPKSRRGRGPNKSMKLPTCEEEKLVLGWSNGKFVGLEPSRQMTVNLTKYFRGAWTSWSQVEAGDRALLWEKFMEYFRVEPPNLVEDARAIWEKQMDDSFRRLVCKQRKDSMKAARLTKLDPKMIKFPPPYVKDEHWAQMCSFWCTNDYEKKSKLSRANRVDNLVLHTGGSISTSECTIRMSQKRNRKVSFIEVYTSMHTTKDGKPIDERAKNVMEAYNNDDDDDDDDVQHDGISVSAEGECSRSLDEVNMAEEIDNDNSLEGSRIEKDFDPNKWKKAVGPTKKRYVLGFGSFSDRDDIYGSPQTKSSSVGANVSPLGAQGAGADVSSSVPAEYHTLKANLDFERKARENLELKLAGVQEVLEQLLNGRKGESTCAANSNGDAGEGEPIHAPNSDGDAGEGEPTPAPNLDGDA